MEASTPTTAFNPPSPPKQEIKVEVKPTVTQTVDLPVVQEPIKPEYQETNQVVSKQPFIDNPEPQEDPSILRQLVQDITKGKYSASELERPAYLRQNVVLHQKPAIPEEAFIPIKLDKHKR